MLKKYEDNGTEESGLPLAPEQATSHFLSQ